MLDDPPEEGFELIIDYVEKCPGHREILEREIIDKISQVPELKDCNAYYWLKTRFETINREVHCTAYVSVVRI